MKYLPLAILTLLVACSSGNKKSGALIEAPAFIPELTAALHAAENRLGMAYKGTGIKVAFKVGRDRYKTGWYGERKTINNVTSILGGVTYQGNYITLYTDPKTGKPHPITSEWEMARSVLYSHGYTTEAAQNPILKAKGFRL